jgi:ArsR family transcriptional regulator, lead/cadmium/zinc/bismuth-responsive transcriptional repressor
VSSDQCDLLCLDLDVAEVIRERSRGRHDEMGRAAERARALGDPTRLSLAAALAEADELCVCDLAWISGRSQNLVSHHLRALRTHQLVRSRRVGKMVMYSLSESGRTLLAAVLGDRVTV